MEKYLFLLIFPIIILAWYLIVRFYYYRKFLEKRETYLKEMDLKEKQFIERGEPIPPRGTIECAPFGKY